MASDERKSRGGGSAHSRYKDRGGSYNGGNKTRRSARSFRDYDFIGDGLHPGDGGHYLQRLWEAVDWHPLAACPGRYSTSDRRLYREDPQRILARLGLPNAPVRRVLREGKDVMLIARLPGGGGLLSYVKDDADGTGYAHTFNTEAGLHRKLLALSVPWSVMFGYAAARDGTPATPVQAFASTMASVLSFLEEPERGNLAYALSRAVAEWFGRLSAVSSWVEDEGKLGNGAEMPSKFSKLSVNGGVVAAVAAARGSASASAARNGRFKPFGRNDYVRQDVGHYGPNGGGASSNGFSNKGRERRSFFGGDESVVNSPRASAAAARVAGRQARKDKKKKKNRGAGGSNVACSPRDGSRFAPVVVSDDEVPSRAGGAAAAAAAAAGSGSIDKLASMETDQEQQQPQQRQQRQERQQRRRRALEGVSDEREQRNEKEEERFKPFPELQSPRPRTRRQPQPQQQPQPQTEQQLKQTQHDKEMRKVLGAVADKGGWRDRNGAELAVDYTAHELRPTEALWYRAAGVLPWAADPSTGEPLLLLGTEVRKDKLVLSYLGGKRDDEDDEDMRSGAANTASAAVVTAFREFHEESGLLLSKEGREAWVEERGRTAVLWLQEAKLALFLHQATAEVAGLAARFNGEEAGCDYSQTSMLRLGWWRLSDVERAVRVDRYRKPMELFDDSLNINLETLRQRGGGSSGKGSAKKEKQSKEAVAAALEEASSSGRVKVQVFAPLAALLVERPFRSAWARLRKEANKCFEDAKKSYAAAAVAAEAAAVAAAAAAAVAADAAMALG